MRHLQRRLRPWRVRRPGCRSGIRSRRPLSARQTGRQPHGWKTWPARG